LHGNYVWLPERECSVQRRNQKVIEEAPSVAMDAATRKKMGDQAVALARSCDYHTTGTVEFLMDANKDFYFLEMNTRLQVEHPITEEITGIDLVEQQILISAGHKLQYKQDDVKINGHSVEYRVYAEDPSRKFLPSIGFLRKYLEPKPHKDIRIDTGVQEGSEISMYYDPMISKLITWGKDRKEAMDLLDKAFDEYVVQGVAHNIGFGKSIVANESFAKGDYSTAFIPDFYPDGYKGDDLNDSQMMNLAMACHRMKNINTQNYKDAADRNQIHNKVVYMTVLGKGDIEDRDWKIELGANSYTVTDMASGNSSELKMDNFEFEHNSLISMDLEEGKEVI
jgi:propionyl-CoA carboxylase alpha chain